MRKTCSRKLAKAAQQYAAVAGRGEPVGPHYAVEGRGVDPQLGGRAAQPTIRRNDAGVSHILKLLTVLVKHAGKVLTHRQLLSEVWGPGSGNETHYLRVYMNQLRQKIEADPAQPRFLLTEPGVGYRLFSDH